MIRNAVTGRRHRATRARLAAVLAVTIAGGGLVIGGAADRSSAASPPVELVSQFPQATTGLTFTYPSISGDGGFLAFTRLPPNNVTVQAVPVIGIVRDRAAQASTVVPAAPSPATAARALTTISRDGCSVVFLSTNAAAATATGLPLVAGWNRCTNTGPQLIPLTLPVPIGKRARPVIGSIASLTVSAHGRYIAANASTTGTPAVFGVLWVDRDHSGSGTLDTAGNTVAKFLPSTFAPSLGDETLTPLVAVTENLGDGFEDVVLWNPQTATDDRTPVSVNAGTNTQGTRSFSPSMSPDGRYVAFVSSDTGLVSPPLQPLKNPQIFVRDMTVQTTRLATRDVTGNPGDGFSQDPSINADGTQVAFVTAAGNLAAGSPGSCDCSGGDLLVVTSHAGFYDAVDFDRVSVNPSGTSVKLANNIVNDQPVISSTGRWVGFESSLGDQLIGPSVIAGQTNIFVVARPPAVSVSSVSFGSVRVGKTSAVKTATISNTGISSVIPAALGPTNPEFVVTATTCPLNVALTPGQSCTVSLVFKPTAEGARSGVLNLSETGFGAITVSGKLAGNGTVPPPTTTTPPTTPPTTPLVAALSIDPPAANFGTVLVGGETPPVTFTVTSTGTAGVAIASATINPGMTGDYPLAGDTCSGKTLAPGEQCQVSVVFRPSVAGDRPAALTVASPAVSVAAALDGAGSFQPVLKLSPNVVAVGQVAIAVGAGFPPGAVVQLKWSTRPEIRSVTAKADGTFQLQIPIGPDELPGPRQLQAIDIPGEFTGVQVPGLVVQRSMQPPTNKNPAFRGITSLIIRG
jgi:Abnormal spindle-like microcephaly-assoc'd, ASPM-SPD-2-Hydin/WD40-like Beta Propeller Repeat